MEHLAPYVENSEGPTNVSYCYYHLLLPFCNAELHDP